MSWFRYSFMIAISFSIFFQKAHSTDCLGKIEFAPAYIHVDVIEDEETVKDLDMPGVRLELDVVIGAGWVIKTNGLYGKEDDGELWTASVAFGRCIPFCDRWVITPLIGGNYTRMDADFDVDLGEELGEISFRERFEGYGAFIGLELIYKISRSLRFCLSGQYAWSHTDTKVNDSESNGQGPSFGASLEYDFNQCWSINLGAAYNESYSREKNGLRASGVKIGLVRWF